MRKFNEIMTRNELADLLGVPRNLLTYVLYVIKPDNLYVHFDIMKKNGEPRHINAPVYELKDIQRKLADALYQHQAIVRSENNTKSTASHGFEKKKKFINGGKCSECNGSGDVSRMQLYIEIKKL